MQVGNRDRQSTTGRLRGAFASVVRFVDSPNAVVLVSGDHELVAFLFYSQAEFIYQTGTS